MAIQLNEFIPVKPAQAGELSCTIVTSVIVAETLRAEWSELLQRAERSELTQSPDWLLIWWNIYGGLEGRQLRVACFREGDRLVGLAPLVRRTHWYRGCVPFRRLELLASGEPEEHGIYSNHIGVIAESGAEAAVARRLAQAIRDGDFGILDEVLLPMMSGDSAMPGLLASSFREMGWHAETRVMAGAPYIPLPATWSSYLRGLSPNGRRNIERSLKALEKWADGALELDCIASPEALDHGKEILIRLHHDRWSGEANTSGVFRHKAHLSFHDAMMARLAQTHALELLILRAKGEPVAALYCMVWHDKVYAYQTGRRADVPANLRPGGVILSLAIRRAIEKGRREFDLLADESFYKSQLTSRVRPLVQVRAARSSIVETARRIGAGWMARVRRKPG